MKERIKCSIFTIQRTNEFFPLFLDELSKMATQSMILVMEGKVGLNALELTGQFHRGDLSY